MKTLGAYEAKTRFGQVLAEVERSKTRFLIQRRGKNVAALIPFEELEASQREEKANHVLSGIDEIRVELTRSELAGEIQEILGERRR